MNTAPKSSRAAKLVSTTDEHGRPVYVRAPRSGREFYSQVGKTKLYEWEKQGLIRGVTIVDPGKSTGTKLYLLQSILDFIGAEMAKQEAQRMAKNIIQPGGEPI